MSIYTYKYIFLKESQLLLIVNILRSVRRFWQFIVSITFTSPPRPHFVTVISKAAFNPISFSDSSDKDDDEMSIDSKNDEQTVSDTESHVSLDGRDNGLLEYAVNSLNNAKSQLGSARQKINNAGSSIADSSIGDKPLNVRTINRANPDESTGNSEPSQSISNPGPSQSTSNPGPSQSASNAGPSTPHDSVDDFEGAANEITMAIDDLRNNIEILVEAVNNAL